MSDVSSSNFEQERKAQITLHLSEFEFPPMQDIMIVGKRAPIGPEAVRKMVTATSPDQYELFKVDHPAFEAIVVRKSVLKMVPKEKLLPIILEEGERVATEDDVIKAQISIVVHVQRGVNL